MSLFKRMFGRGEEAHLAPAAAPILVNAYSTLRELPPLDFAHELHGRRDLSDPELAPHLEGFIGYVLGRGDGQMTAARYHLWRHLQRVRNQLSFMVADDDLGAVEAWAAAANAVLFLPDGSVRSPDLAVLLSIDGASDPAAALPYQPDAIARRQRTRAALAGLTPQPPAGMPPAIGEGELVLRTPAEVLRRALALLYVAASAQAQDTGGEPIPAGRRERNPLGSAAVTPDEQAFLEGDGQAAAAMTWRYETANTLLWALGYDAADITASDRMIDVDALWASVEPVTRSGGVPEPRLRPPAEILDALDRTWLEHWIVRQARQMGVPLEGISSDVVMERHAALNWLTGFQNDFGTSWDGIDTPT